jgi:hypothetical protein
MDPGAGSLVHRRVAALAVGALLGAAGCAPPADDPLLRHPFTEFPGQAVRGTLAGDPPCLGVTSSRGWTVLVWPTQASAAVDARIVVELDGRVATAGTTTGLAGGFVERDSAYERQLAAQGVVERCPADTYFLVAEVGP